MKVVINPGSGPVANATAAQAAVNIKQFVADLAIRGLNVVDICRTPEADYDREDNDGRFAFDLTFDDGRMAMVQMPGIPVEQVRWLGPDQDIWQFPRLYVDDSSWVWFYALNACHDDADPRREVTNPGTAAGSLPTPEPRKENLKAAVIADRPPFGQGGPCPECGADLVPNNCTSGVCPSTSCHKCGYGCDLFTNGAGKCITALRKKLPPTRYER